MGKLARSQFEAIRELKIKKLKICYDFCGDGGSTYLESVKSSFFGSQSGFCGDFSSKLQ